MREIGKIPEESSNTREMKAYHQVFQEWGGQYPRSQEEGQPPSGEKKIQPTKQTKTTTTKPLTWVQDLKEYQDFWTA